MAMSKEDYFLSLVMDMDNTKAKTAFQELQKALGDVKTAELAAGSAANIKERIDKEKELAQLKHKLLLEELRVQGDPSAVRERQRRDKEIIDARRAAAQGGAGGIGSTLGGTVGMALGGPAGSAIGSMLGSMAGDVVGGAVSGVKALGSALSSLNSGLGPINLGFDALDKILPGVGNTLKQITGELVQMAAVASPSAMKQFSMAVSDVQGIIGQSFLPVLELMRQGVEVVGNIIAEVIPDMNEVGSALAMFQESFIELRSAIKSFMADWGPVIRDILIGALRAVGDAAGIAARAFSVLTTALRYILAPIRALLNLMGIGLGTAGRTAQGAAARAVQIEDFSAYQRRLQQTAFREPGGVTAADVPKMTQEIQNNTERMARWTDTFTPERLGRAIADEMDARRGNAAARDAIRDGRNGRGIGIDNGEGGGGNW